MEQYTLESGRKSVSMERESRFGRMDLFMRDSGLVIELRDMGDSTMQMETSMREYNKINIYIYI